MDPTTAVKQLGRLRQLVSFIEESGQAELIATAKAAIQHQELILAKLGDESVRADDRQLTRSSELREPTGIDTPPLSLKRKHQVGSQHTPTWRRNTDCPAPDSGYCTPSAKRKKKNTQLFSSSDASSASQATAGRRSPRIARSGSQNSQVRKPVRTENVPSPRDTPSLFGDCSRPRSAQSSQSDALSAKQAPTGRRASFLKARPKLRDIADSDSSDVLSPRKMSSSKKGRHRVARDSQAFNAMKKVMKAVMDHDNSADFLVPVGPEVKDYYDIIKNPMDFGEVWKRLGVSVENCSQSQYTEISDVLKDVKLVFENCERYNENDHEVYRNGRELEKCFATSLKRLLPQYFATYTPAMLDREDMEEIDRNPDDGDKDDDDDDDDDNDDDDDDDNEIDNEIDDDDEPGKEFIDDEALVNNHCYFGRSMTPNEGPKRPRSGRNGSAFRHVEATYIPGEIEAPYKTTPPAISIDD